MSFLNGPSQFWTPLDREFFRETLKSVILFSVIASVALLLYAVKLGLQHLNVSIIIIVSIEIIEYTILICDVIWFIAKLIGTTILALKRIYTETKNN